jgi:N-acetylmuramoyl-L-alanine amidase
VGGGDQTGVVGMAPTLDGGGYWTVTSGAPLAGRVIAVDPGHDGGNGADPSGIGTPVFNGRSDEACDTAGTETAGGYTEHAFNFDVAVRLQAMLETDGATVVLTRTNDSGVGPCINQRAAIGNAARADAAVSIHADGGPVGGRGFTVIEPLPVHPYNDAIVAPSAVLGGDMVTAYQRATGLPTSSYDGMGGVDRRDDLGGLNLSAVPKVLIETANMRNPTDAALLEDPAFRQRVAEGIATGIVAFLPAA